MVGRGLETMEASGTDTYLLNKCLSHIYYVPDSVPSTVDINPHSPGSYSSREKHILHK